MTMISEAKEVNINVSKTFNTTEFTDEQFRGLLDRGYTVKQIEALYARMFYRKQYNARPEVQEKRKQYRDKYNQRPEVKARRKEYMKRRNEKMREMTETLRGL